MKGNLRMKATIRFAIAIITFIDPEHTRKNLAQKSGTGGAVP